MKVYVCVSILLSTVYQRYLWFFRLFLYSRISNNINGTHLGSKEKEGVGKTVVTDHTKEPYEEEKV